MRLIPAASSISIFHSKLNTEWGITAGVALQEERWRGKLSTCIGPGKGGAAKHPPVGIVGMYYHAGLIYNSSSFVDGVQHGFQASTFGFTVAKSLLERSHAAL